jgi:hypothetical protein
VLFDICSFKFEGYAMRRICIYLSLCLAALSAQAQTNSRSSANVARPQPQAQQQRPAALPAPQAVHPQAQFAPAPVIQNLQPVRVQPAPAPQPVQQPSTSTWPTSLPITTYGAISAPRVQTANSTPVTVYGQPAAHAPVVNNGGATYPLTQQPVPARVTAPAQTFIPSPVQTGAAHTANSTLAIIPKQPASPAQTTHNIPIHSSPSAAPQPVVGSRAAIPVSAPASSAPPFVLPEGRALVELMKRTSENMGLQSPTSNTSIAIGAIKEIPRKAPDAILGAVEGTYKGVKASVSSTIGLAKQVATPSTYLGAYKEVKAMVVEPGVAKQDMATLSSGVKATFGSANAAANKLLSEQDARAASRDIFQPTAQLAADLATGNLASRGGAVLVQTTRTAVSELPKATTYFGRATGTYEKNVSATIKESLDLTAQGKRSNFYDLNGRPVKWMNPETASIEPIPTGVKIHEDHIFPIKEIKQLDGFDKLTATQQKMILDEPLNKQPLAASLNCSKGAKVCGTENSWEAYKGKDLPIKYTDWLTEQQDLMRKLLQSKINSY